MHAALELAARLRQALISVNEDLVSTLDLDEVLRRALVKGAQAVGADLAVLEMRSGNGWVVQETWGLPEGLCGLELGEYEAPLAALAMRKNKPIIVDAESESAVHQHRRYGMSSALVVPLWVSDQMAGVILFGHSARTRFFESAHLEFAHNLSVSMALAMENARLYQQQRSLARTLEQAILDIPQVLPGVEFGHLYRSATEEARVGGDFYDVFGAKHGQIGLLIGDVSGHGVEAARVATFVKDTVHAFAHQFRRPHLVLRETNRLLVERKFPGFVTVFLGFLDPSTGNLVFSSAGHPPPLLLADGGVVTQLESIHHPLGAFADAHYRDSYVDVKEGSVLLLYTDGVTDSRRDRELFGEDRLGHAFASTPQREDRSPALPSPGERCSISRKACCMTMSPCLPYIMWVHVGLILASGLSGKESDMGILDSLKGLAAEQGSGAAAGLGGKDLSGVITGLIGQGGSQLPGLLEKMHAGGLGNVAQSWVGKGANLPINPQQVQAVLGSDAVAGIAAKLGITPEAAAAKVAGVLPEVIDKLTPDGVVPDPKALSDKVMGLLKL